MMLIKSLVVIFVVMVSCIGSPTWNAWSTVYEARLSKGQTIYVPVYSNVYSGAKKNPLQLAATLSIRSVDPVYALKVTAIDYYDNDGKLVRKFLTFPITLAPFATHHVYIEEKDTKGGFGANFIVRWNSDRVINAPIVECVMIGSGQGISFISSGQELRE